jgi:hypothetical protein
MPKPFYKHKLLLDEHLPPRQFLPRLNEHFDVKHIKHDLHHGGMEDPPIHELAVKQGRIILTRNVEHFRPLMGSVANFAQGALKGELSLIGGATTPPVCRIARPP